MSASRQVTLLLALATATGGCSLFHRSPPPAPTANEGRPGTITTASWYRPRFHGRRTASGEIFDQQGLSAASASLPLGTWVRVTNVENGRSVRVRITDRGPFVRGRSLDLSYGAARRLGMIERGTGRVRIEVSERPQSRSAGTRRRPHRTGSRLAHR